MAEQNGDKHDGSSGSAPVTSADAADNATSNNSGHLHVSSHPIIAHKITQLRSSSTNCGTFRNILKEVTYHLGYEATTQLTTKSIDISVPRNKNDHVDWKGRKLVEKVALIPILRSGLGMVDSMLELLPKAQVHHIGMYKTMGDARPVQYYNRLPKVCVSDVAYVLDAVIATSSTVLSVVGILKKVGNTWTEICSSGDGFVKENHHFSFCHLLIIVGSAQDSYHCRDRFQRWYTPIIGKTSRCVHYGRRN
jgi:uracil phosphoribosyltransferase